MPKNVPSLKPRELLRILIGGGCSFLRHDTVRHDIFPAHAVFELDILGELLHKGIVHGRLLPIGHFLAKHPI